MESNEIKKIEINGNFFTEKEALARGLDFHKKGDYGNAESIYRKIYNENPKNSDVLHLSALILYHFGYFDSAIYWIKRAISLNNKIPQYYYNMGLIFMDSGNTSEAIDCFNKSKELNSRYASGWEMVKSLSEKKYGN